MISKHKVEGECLLAMAQSILENVYEKSRKRLPRKYLLGSYDLTLKELGELVSRAGWEVGFDYKISGRLSLTITKRRRKQAP